MQISMVEMQPDDLYTFLTPSEWNLELILE